MWVAMIRHRRADSAEDRRDIAVSVDGPDEPEGFPPRPFWRPTDSTAANGLQCLDDSVTSDQ